MDSHAAALLAMGIAVGLGAIGPGIGMGTAVASAIDATARQPEVEGKARVLMFIGLAFMEALALYALVIAFILLGQATPKEQHVSDAGQTTYVAQTVQK